MKKDIHPNYRKVVFKDISSGKMFLTGSTIKTKEVVKFEGEEYPLIISDITSDSHPFFTGEQKLVDAAGRIEKFNRKYKKNA